MSLLKKLQFCTYTVFALGDELYPIRVKGKYDTQIQHQGVPSLKRRKGTGITASEIEQTEEFNGQFTDVFNKNDHGEVPFLIRSAPFMDDIDVSNEDVTKFLKGLNPSKA